MNTYDGKMVFFFIPGRLLETGYQNLLCLSNIMISKRLSIKNIGSKLMLNSPVYDLTGRMYPYKKH